MMKWMKWMVYFCFWGRSQSRLLGNRLGCGSIGLCCRGRLWRSLFCFLSYVSVIFEERERERGTYEEKPFGEEAFGLGEVGCQEGGHGGFVFWEWFCGKW